VAEYGLVLTKTMFNVSDNSPDDEAGYSNKQENDGRCQLSRHRASSFCWAGASPVGIERLKYRSKLPRLSIK